MRADRALRALGLAALVGMIATTWLGLFVTPDASPTGPCASSTSTHPLPG
jgi:hypothetical protein